MTSSEPSKKMVASVRLTIPSGTTADAERLREALRAAGFERVTIPLSVLRELPRALRATGPIGASLVATDDGWHLASIGAGKKLAVAMDLGSTNIAASLVDPDTGAIADGTIENPQTSFSADILDRILHSETRMDELHPPLIASVNALIEKICRSAGKKTADVVLLAIAGNTAMGHLLLGIEATALPVVPNNPAFHRPGFFNASDLGIRLHQEGKIFLFPNVGAFAGGDTVAGILASGIHRDEKISALIDVGTNVEIAMGNRDFILVAAGAAGPALEGGIVAHAGVAEEGAIDRVRIDPDSLAIETHTIGGGRPSHLCGSGLIDLLAGLFERGFIDGRGKFSMADRRIVVDAEGGKKLVIVPGPESVTGRDILFSERDIENLITSKAGMYALIRTMTGHLGIEVEDIGRFYVAGDVGQYIDPERAMTIGMLPVLPLNRFVSLGNSSLKGAVALVMDRDRLAGIDEILSRITYIDMNTDPLFMQELPGGLFLPHTETERFRRKG